MHGPQPRDYSYKLPRKMLLGALRSALSAKVRDGELKVVQAFDFADHKTKNAHGRAGASSKPDARCWWWTTATTATWTLGSRNLEGRDAAGHAAR